MEEIFKDIVWYEWIYQIGNLGNVKSLNFNNMKVSKLLKPLPTNCWYVRVWLTKWKKDYTYFSIHRLVALHFIDNPKDKPQVNHIDWDKKNNTITNLEWNTKSENMLHSYRNNLHKRVFWKDNHLSKKIWQYTLDWTFIKMWYSITEAANALWVNKSSIWKNCKWLTQKCKWFTFQYVA